MNERAPEEQQSNDVWLTSILTWPLWKSFFDHGKEFSLGRKIAFISLVIIIDLNNCDQDILKCIIKAKDVVVDVVQLLEKDRRSVTHFDNPSKIDTFLEVCFSLDARTPSMDLSLRERAEEAMRKAVIAEKRLLNNFLRLCSELENGKLYMYKPSYSVSLSSVSLTRIFILSLS